MNVTHDQILALLVIKDQKIMALEAELELQRALNRNLEAAVKALQPPETPADTQ